MRYTAEGWLCRAQLVVGLLAALAACGGEDGLPSSLVDSLVCDGSDDIIYINANEATGAARVHPYFLTSGSEFFVVDGTCRFWSGGRVGNLTQDELRSYVSAIFPRSVPADDISPAIAQVAERDSWLDAHGWRAGSVVCGWPCPDGGRRVTVERRWELWRQLVLERAEPWDPGRFRAEVILYPLPESEERRMLPEDGVLARIASSPLGGGSLGDRAACASQGYETSHPADVELLREMQRGQETVAPWDFEAVLPDGQTVVVWFAPFSPWDSDTDWRPHLGPIPITGDCGGLSDAALELVAFD